MKNANLAEFLGTFALVLIGPGAISIQLSNFWIAFAFGMVVSLMIACFGKISGAHINPAVSLGFYFVSKNKDFLRYIPYQILGGISASFLIWILIPGNQNYGETLPSGTIHSTLTIEVVITFLLMLSILIIGKTKRFFLIAPIVGLVVFLAAYFAGPYTGASMNPARSIGPAIVSGEYEALWIYILAPPVGAWFAVLFHNKVNKLKYSS